MKRLHAFLLGLLAFGLVAVSFAGLFMSPPCISGPSVPREYPVFIASFCLNYVLGNLILLIAGTIGFRYALRET